MALPNGVLVHGPTSWACAVAAAERRARRSPPGAKRVPGGRASSSRCCAARPRSPSCSRCCRGPRASCPRRGCRSSGASVLGVDGRERGRRARSCAVDAGSARSPQESSAAAVDRARRRSRCAAPSSPPTTAPSTSRSARYEHGEQREKEHERCGRTSSARCSSRRGRRRARQPRPEQLAPAGARGAAVGALAASTEIFVWMTRHPEHRSRAARRPGHELQHRLPPPSRRPQQLEVAEAALQACLELEHATPRTRLAGIDRADAARRAAPARDLRSPGREDAGGLLHRRVLQPHAGRAARRRPPPAGRHAGLPEADSVLGGMDEAIAILASAPTTGTG